MRRHELLITGAANCNICVVRTRFLYRVVLNDLNFRNGVALSGGVASTAELNNQLRMIPMDYKTRGPGTLLFGHDNSGEDHSRTILMIIKQKEYLQ